MVHCPVCFKILDGGAARCSRCGWAVPGRDVEDRGGVDGEALVGQTDTGAAQDRMRVAVRWVRGILILLLVLVLVAEFARVLVVENRAAQASWRVQSQLVGWRMDRRAVLKRALAELAELHAELLDPEVWSQEPARTEAFRADWRRRLNRVKAAYLLTGQARFGGANVRAEEALHNLVLYLSSLERALDTPDPETKLELERSIGSAFRDAEAYLR